MINNKQNTINLDHQVLKTLGNSISNEYSDLLDDYLSGWTEGFSLYVGDIQELLFLTAEVREFQRIEFNFNMLVINLTLGFFPMEAENFTNISESYTFDDGFKEEQKSGQFAKNQNFPDQDLIEINNDKKSSVISIEDYGAEVTGKIPEFLIEPIPEEITSININPENIDFIDNTRKQNSIFIEGKESIPDEQEENHKDINLSSGTFQRAKIPDKEKGEVKGEKQSLHPINEVDSKPIKGLKKLAQFLESFSIEEEANYPDQATIKSPEMKDNTANTSFSPAEAESIVIPSNDFEVNLNKPATIEELNLLLGITPDQIVELDNDKTYQPLREVDAKKRRRTNKNQTGEVIPIQIDKTSDRFNNQANNLTISNKEIIREEKTYNNFLQAREILRSDFSQIDINEIMETLAEEIYREYKRFYGS